MFRGRTRLQTVLIVGLVLLLAVGFGGCKPKTGDGGTPPEGSGNGGTGGSPGGTLDLTQPGNGLPTVLPSGVLAIGLHSWDGETMVLATIDPESRGLTRHFTLSPYERSLLLSPDGTRLATLNGGPYNYDSDLIFWVYDLTAGTLTKLPRPVSQAYPGYPATFGWSPDSAAIIYTCTLIGESDGDRLARVPADGSSGRFVEGLKLQAFQFGLMAPVPEREAVLYTDDGPADGFSLHRYDFGTSQSTTILPSGVEAHLTVSKTGRHAAFIGFHRSGALGMAWEYPITILDLDSGQLVRIPELQAPFTVMGLVWAPTGDLLALVWEKTDAYPSRIGVTVYDLTGGVKCATEAIDVYNHGCDRPVVWAPDGATLFVAGGPSRDMNLPPAGATTIYRVDVATGAFQIFFTTSSDEEGIRGLMITP